MSYNKRYKLDVDGRTCLRYLYRRVLYMYNKRYYFNNFWRMTVEEAHEFATTVTGNVFKLKKKRISCDLPNNSDWGREHI
jgi:hypothetical protein